MQRMNNRTMMTIHAQKNTWDFYFDVKLGTHKVQVFRRVGVWGQITLSPPFKEKTVGTDDDDDDSQKIYSWRWIKCVAVCHDAE